MSNLAIVSQLAQSLVLQLPPVQFDNSNKFKDETEVFLKNKEPVAVILPSLAKDKEGKLIESPLITDADIAKAINSLASKNENFSLRVTTNENNKLTLKIFKDGRETSLEFYVEIDEAGKIKETSTLLKSLKSLETFSDAGLLTPDKVKAISKKLSDINTQGSSSIIVSITKVEEDKITYRLTQSAYKIGAQEVPETALGKEITIPLKSTEQERVALFVSEIENIISTGTYSIFDQKKSALVPLEMSKENTPLIEILKRADSHGFSLIATEPGKASLYYKGQLLEDNLAFDTQNLISKKNLAIILNKHLENPPLVITDQSEKNSAILVDVNNPNYRELKDALSKGFSYELISENQEGTQRKYEIRISYADNNVSEQQATVKIISFETTKEITKKELQKSLAASLAKELKPYTENLPIIIYSNSEKPNQLISAESEQYQTLKSAKDKGFHLVVVGDNPENKTTTYNVVYLPEGLEIEEASSVGDAVTLKDGVELKSESQLVVSLKKLIESGVLTIQYNDSDLPEQPIDPISSPELYEKIKSLKDQKLVVDTQQVGPYYFHTYTLHQKNADGSLGEAMGKPLILMETTENQKFFSERNKYLLEYFTTPKEEITYPSFSTVKLSEEGLKKLAEANGLDPKTNVFQNMDLNIAPQLAELLKFMREVRTDGTGNLNMMFLGYNPKTENFSFALHRGEVKEAGDKATFFTLPDPKDPKKRIPRFYVINQSETTNPSILALIAAKEGNDYYQSKGIALERKTNSAGNIDVEVKSTDSLEYRARLGVARQNFLDAYRNNGASVDKIKYIENELAIFEKRMSLLSAINHKNPTRVTEFQNKTVETYEHLSKFLNNKNPTFVGYFNKFKLELVENIIFQAANPTRINQGFNPTCNITSVEIFTAYVSPNRYAEFILNVAQNGQYSNGEKSHNFNARNLVPEYGYYKGWSPNVQAQGSNIRSPASRLFQVGGINFTRGNNYFSTGNPEFNDNEIQRAARLIAREGFEYANIRRMSADHHSRLMKGIPVAYRSDNHIQAVIPQILEKGNGNYYINFYMDDSNGGTTYTNPVATLEKPVLKVNSLISNDVRLGDLLTSDVNVVFYSATWCDPCNRSYDSISRAANLPAIKDTPIIGLYSADSAQSLLEQKKHPPFTIQQFQLQRYQKALSQLSDGTKVSSFPTFFIVDREGNVLARHPGGITGEQLNSLLDTIKKAKK